MSLGALRPRLLVAAKMEKIPDAILKRFRLQQIDKKSAAISQLESAILIWINNRDRDAASIHTLAIAASDCFNAICAQHGRPSPFKQWLRAQPRKFQDMAAEAQNFLKHGAKDWHKQIKLSPMYAEMLMYDSVVSHEKVLGPASPLMRAFATRFVIENREILGEKFERSVEGLNVDYIDKLDRAESVRQLVKLFQLVRGNSIPPILLRLIKSS